MTNLLIAYPDIPARALQRAASVTFDEDAGLSNLLRGERHLRGIWTAGASGVTELEFDLGSGNSGSVNVLALARADRLIQLGTTGVEVLRTSTGIGGSYTSVFSATLTDFVAGGPNGTDRLKYDFSAGPYRGWKVKFTGGSASTRMLSKLFLGTALDMGKSPSAFGWERIVPPNSRDVQDSGASAVTRLEEPLYRFTLEWRLITDAVRAEFEEKIDGRAHEHRFMLFTTAQHQILANALSAHVKLVDCTLRPEKDGDGNRITAVFEELPG